MDYKKILKTILIYENLNQSELSEKIGYSRQKVSRLLNDDRVTDVNTLLDLLGGLDSELIIRYKDKDYKLNKLKKD